MPVPLAQMMEGLTDAQRAEVERGATRIVAESRTLRGLRRKRGLTQEAVAAALETTQGNVAQIEAKGDALVSTVDQMVRAMGGRLRLMVDMPGEPMTELVLGKEIATTPPAARIGRRAARDVEALVARTSGVGIGGIDEALASVERFQEALAGINRFQDALRSFDAADRVAATVAATSLSEMMARSARMDAVRRPTAGRRRGKKGAPVEPG